jgi:hypothetical protein
MLKELQREDKRYKKGLEEKVKSDLAADYRGSAPPSGVTQEVL